MEETCQKCGSTISRRAKANLWQGEQVVCTPCLRELEAGVLRQQHFLRMAGKAHSPWALRDGDAQRGPYTTAQLIELLRRGQVDWSAMIRREGMTEWKPVARLFTIPQMADGRLELREFGQGDGTYQFRPEKRETAPGVPPPFVPKANPSRSSVSQPSTRSPESFCTELAGGIKATGTPEFWDIVKGAKLRRRERDFPGAIREFERAIALAHSYQCDAIECKAEIARTLWHDGQVPQAITMADQLLPDMSAVKLLASIWREQGKGFLKASDGDNALKCFRCIEDLGKLNGFPLLTANDRETLEILRARPSS